MTLAVLAGFLLLMALLIVEVLTDEEANDG